MWEELSPLRRFSAQTVKYTLFMFNLVLVLSGVTLICLGIIVKEAYTEYEPIVDHSYFSASTLLCASGALLFIFSFFGCCGAYKENHNMLILYSTLIGMVFLLELAAVITGYSLSNKPTGFLQNALTQTFNETNSPVTMLFWDKMETKLECCGINNSSDYKIIRNNDTIPGTCCGLTADKVCNKTDTFPGCLDKVQHLIERNAVTIATGALSAILLQIVGMVCAIWLAKSIMSSYETF